MYKIKQSLIEPLFVYVHDDRGDGLYDSYMNSVFRKKVKMISYLLNKFI